jgi:glycosyltransferase involved in cell wall biosynthesis
VSVYCRRSSGGSRRKSYLGMRLVQRPALRLIAAETLSHTALSVAHIMFSAKPDLAFVFNAANAPFVPWLRVLGVPAAVHVDGLEWKREKWNGAGRRYYLSAEKLAVRTADALIADAQGIVDYYSRKFLVETEFLSYGTRIIRNPASDRLRELGIRPHEYHLVVARFEPENHVDLIIEGYHRSNARYPLVVVGSANYPGEYVDRITTLAATDRRVRLVGGLWDQPQLDQLYANALTYAHGHSVGGTNPSLLRAMGGGTSVLAYDVDFNREVLGDDGRYFTTPESLRELIGDAERHAFQSHELGQRLQRRAGENYDWDVVAGGYEALALRLAAGYSIRNLQSSHEPMPADRPQRPLTSLHRTDSRNP